MNLSKTSHVVLILLLLFFTSSNAAWAQDGARLFIETIPDNVTIRILNNPGSFQQGMKLKPGTYLIRLSKQGFEAQTKKISIKNSDDFKLKVSLEAQNSQADAPPESASPADAAEQAPPDAGRLFVQADPPDATVRILRIKPVFQQGIALEPGTYTVEVSKDGYATKKRDVQIRKGQDSKVEIALFLKADMGKLYVNTDPMDANIRLPHIKPAYDPGMELSPGDYTVEISKDGFKTVTVPVTIANGKIKRLNVTLKKTDSCGQGRCGTIRQTGRTAGSSVQRKPDH